MGERGSHPGLGLESHRGFLIRHEVVRKELDGNCAFEFEVFGFPNLSLPSGTEAFKYPIARDRLIHL